jgi:hypothetical protein
MSMPAGTDLHFTLESTKPKGFCFPSFVMLLVARFQKPVRIHPSELHVMLQPLAATGAKRGACQIKSQA